MESLIRKNAPVKILFNCPSWNHTDDAGPGNIPKFSMQCIDGLQRLTAILAFMRGEVPIFGGQNITTLVGTPFDARRYRISLAVYEFQWRDELLAFYLDLNIGGTVHTSSEIERVTALMEQARAERLETKSERPAQAAGRRPRGGRSNSC